MKRFIFMTLIVTIAIMSMLSGSRANPIPSPNDILTDLIVGTISTDEDPYERWIGVRVRLGSAWKIYWKSPGDTGAPSEFDWSATPNLVAATVQWPKPHRTSILGVESIGYTDEVIFPVKVQLLDPDLNTNVELKFTLYACSAICIREARTLKADLSRPSGVDAQDQIEEWRAKVPAERTALLAIEIIDVVQSNPPLVRVESAQTLGHPDLFVASVPAGTYASRPKIESVGNRTVMTATLQGDPDEIKRASSIEVTVVAESGAIAKAVQFQEPVFLAAMALVISFFAANLLGLFEIALPTTVMNALARRGFASSVPSHFASGFVATLLATPCSAPFVGTAVAFALSRGPQEILGIFGMLGLGMATPYFLAACVPDLAVFLPRPGPWLLWLKRALAMPLLATVGWLIWIISATTGSLPALGIAIILAGGFIALWWRTVRPSRDAVIAVLYAVSVAVGMAVILRMPASKPAETEHRDIAWRPFNQLDSLVRSGRTVFLDVTADWCVTCKVNKRLVINDPQILSRLSRDVIPVRADWTRPDSQIAKYLKSFGRFGIPFNVVFGPSAPEGIVLPEILTKAAVLSAFANSSSAPQSIQQK